MIWNLQNYHHLFPIDEDFKSFELSNVNSLQSIEFGDECFLHVREFVIDGLESLEVMKIGEYCFRIDDKERDDGLCRITNCPNLRQLKIGWSSFEDFKSFELFNLNSLQSIEFGHKCFYYADFLLKGEWKVKTSENESDVLDLPSLEKVSFGRESFDHCHLVVFESMWE